MKLAMAVCLVSGLTACSHTRSAPPASSEHGRMFRICAGDRFGYIDQSGAVTIAPTYAFVEDFEGDRAIAWTMPREQETDSGQANPQIEGRGGFIDRTGRFVVPPIYEHVEPLRDGLAVVGIGGRYGYVDREGHVRLPLQFRIAETFSEGLGYVEDDAGRRYIDAAGKTVVDMDHVKWTANGREAVVTGAGPFSGGLAAIRYYTPGLYGAEGWGFMDRTGTIVVEPRFRYAYGMRDGLALVSVPSEGAAPGGDAIIDRSGRYVIPPGSGALGVPHQGRVKFSTRVGGASKSGFLDLRRQVIVQPQFDHTCLLYSEGLCAVMRGGRWGFIDEAGREIATLPPDTTFADEFHSGLAKVQTREGEYYVHRDGTRAFEGFFRHAGRFEDGLALVIFEDQAFGYVDVRGRVIYRGPAPCTSWMTRGAG